MSHHCEHHQDQDCDCEGKCKDGGGDCGEGFCCCGDCCGSSCHCDKACCEGGHFQRRFKMKAERIAELESYLSELKKEVQAVEEMLADLHK